MYIGEKRMFVSAQTKRTLHTNSHKKWRSPMTILSKRWSLLSNVQGPLNWITHQTCSQSTKRRTLSIKPQVLPNSNTLTDCTALSAVQVIVYSGRGFGSW